MLSFFLRGFYALIFFCALTPAAAQAESLVLQFNKTTQMTQTAGAAAAAGAKDSTQTITLYPAAYSSRSGQTENIYDFDKKTFTILNHNAKIYTVYPLHSIAIFRDLDRVQRLNMKVSMYHQKASTALPLTALMQDVDIDMLLAANKSTKTADRIKTQTDGNIITYSSDTQNTLAVLETGDTAVPAALRKTYAHMIVYEFSMHPVIKQSAAAQNKVFQTLTFTNRDIFRNLAVTYKWALASAAATEASAPAIPDDYTRMYSGDRDVDAAFKTAQTPYAFDAADLQAKITERVEKQQYLHAFLIAQEARISMHPAAFAAQQSAFNLAFKAAETFERAAYLATIQTPDHHIELKQYLDIFEKTKPRAGERTWLLDYYGARHIREVLSKKTPLTKTETEQLAATRGQFLETLKKLPHCIEAYQLLADSFFNAMEIPTAMLYWEQMQALGPDLPAAKKFAKLKADTEKDFPEYF